MDSYPTLVLKSCAIMAVFISVWIGALLPFVIRRGSCISEKRQTQIISLFNCVSGGFFVSASMFHILTSSAGSFQKLSKLLDGKGIAQYPAFPYMIMSLGFMIPFLIQHILGAIIITKDSDEEEESYGQIVEINNGDKRRNKHDKDSSHKLVSILMTCVMSTLSFLIGITSGVISDTSEAAVLVFTMIFHKSIAGFSVSTQAIKANFPVWQRIIPMTFAFSLTTPAGIFTGIMLSRFITNQFIFLIIGIIFKSLGSGMFIYLATMIILRNELKILTPGGHHHSKISYF
ncbi:hypothetical protein ABK040_002377 [Willaertia magna]